MSALVLAVLVEADHRQADKEQAGAFKARVIFF